MTVTDQAAAGTISATRIPSVRWMPTPQAGPSPLDAARPGPSVPVGSPEFLSAAGRSARLLPPNVHDALVDVQDAPPRSGAVLVRGVPVGPLPATPARPTDHPRKDAATEFVLLTIARRLGQPVGYLPEHGGDVVQNLVPTPDAAHRQVSTSSAVDLAFHTETAFHPHAPRFLVLLCLRGDPAAATTLCTVHDVLPHLDQDTLAVLREPRFVCGVDESFTHGLPVEPTAPRAIIGGTADRPTFWFDADLMRGTDPAAEVALARLRAVVTEQQRGVVLEAGDCLVVDNTVAVHGRTAYPARFDGTDRWLQRTFVVSDLVPSLTERVGRVITTRFT